MYKNILLLLNTQYFFSAITILSLAPPHSSLVYLLGLSNALPVTMYLVYYRRVGTRSILLQTRLGKSDISSPDALLDLIGTMNYEHRNTHFWLGGTYLQLPLQYTTQCTKLSRFEIRSKRNEGTLDNNAIIYFKASCIKDRCIVYKWGHCVRHITHMYRL